MVSDDRRYMVELALISSNERRVLTSVWSIIERYNLKVEAVSTFRVSEDLLRMIIAVKDVDGTMDFAVRKLRKVVNVVDIRVNELRATA